MKFYCFSSTHWDREWYLPFERYRIKLVDLAEKLLENLETVPGWEQFIFDGQTVVLEDITELRPDLRRRLIRQVKAGKLKVGPWYVMPDEFLVSGEALIRNLLTGRELARRYGCEPWPVGYVCDVFGHIAQLPQLLRGFGIGCAVAARGIPWKSPQFLRWKAPDGSLCDLVKLAHGGYGHFSFLLGLNGAPLEKKAFLAKFRPYVERYRETDPDVVILPDAQDHTIPHRQQPEVLRWIREAYPEAELRLTDFTSLPEFAQENILPVLTGELADTASENGAKMMKLVAHSLSSRYDIKLANDLAQNRLELELEPFLAMRAASGDFGKTDRALLRRAWRTLLKNQAHDSICGCSTDETHFMQMPRYREVMQIVDGIFGRLDPQPGMESGEYFRLRIFNPLPYPREGVIRVTLPLPCDYPASFAEPRAPEAFASFRLHAANGEEIPYTLLKVEKNMHRILYAVADEYHIALKTRLEPCAWTTLELTPSAVPVRDFETQRTGRRSAANEFLSLEINSDGTFSVTDRESGALIREFNEYLLDSDAGDGWYHVPPVGGRTLLSTPESASVALLTDCSFLTEFEIVQRFRFSAGLNFRASANALYNTTEQSEEEAVITIRSIVSLEAGSRLLKVRTTLDNVLKDCRLRLSVPTGLSGSYLAGQAFTLNTRMPGRATGNATIAETEMEPLEKNFSGLLIRNDGKRGIAFLNPAGLHEAACFSGDESKLCITLFRAFRRTINRNGEPDGELQKRLVFDYAYSFYPGPPVPAGLYRELLFLRCDAPLLFQRSQHPSPLPDKPFLRLFGELVFSAMKPAEDGSGIILRLFNPSCEKKSGEAVLRSPAESVSLCTPAEEEYRTLSGHTDRIPVTAGPFEIVTLKLSFHQGEQVPC
ncbi:MAG: hypothetical protein HPZ91_00850 [Lentisphaeria bacterium]|nr:hypothetical protein [Lentisphaeria bacterium]